MAPGGYIHWWRCVTEHPLYRERRRFSRYEAWEHLVLNAAFRDHIEIWGGRKVHVKRGQCLFSGREKAKNWGWARMSFKRFLEYLEAEQMVSREVVHGPDGGYTLLTILNYERFQGDGLDRTGDQVDRELDHAVDHAEATRESIISTEEGKEVKKGIAGARPAPAGGSGNGNGPGRKPRKTHPETDTLLAEFGTLYEKKWGKPYLPTFARDKKLLHDMLAVSSVEEVRARMIAFLIYGTKWTRDTGKYDVPAFRSAWNEIGVLKARGDL